MTFEPVSIGTRNSSQRGAASGVAWRRMRMSTVRGDAAVGEAFGETMGPG
jgi:hypothetical protein